MADKISAEKKQSGTGARILEERVMSIASGVNMSIRWPIQSLLTDTQTNRSVYIGGARSANHIRPMIARAWLARTPGKEQEDMIIQE